MRNVRPLAFGIALACCLTMGVRPAAAASAIPETLTHLGDARQVIVVTAPSWSSTRGTLTAWEQDVRGWRRVVAPVTAILGAHGLVPSAERRQSTGTTPAGTFALPFAFGRRPDPGSGLPYTRLNTWDAWPYSAKDPSTYNVLQDANVSWDSYGHDVEHLWRHGVQYDYVAVMDYNLPAGPITTGPDGVRRATAPANTSAGGGIFLHVSDGRTTAGCIAVPRRVMRGLLRWLDSTAHPVIVVGPSAQITSM